MTDLPIHAVLPELLAALRQGPYAVLIAPPGAGKTTSVAPALIREPWCSGKVILLSPRRVAARAAAERMAELLGESAGQTVGYLTRLDSKQSAKTRILVMTEAIFVATILHDPELQGVSAVLFDEAHERHLDSDLGLALAVESAGVLREDLRIVPMSATIDGQRFASLLGANTPVIESEGKAWPLSFRWLGAAPEKRLEEAMTSAVLTAWREQEGDILAFLPGVGEITRTVERLSERLSDALVLPLHGQCEPAAQRAAIRRDPAGRRRIVLATSIAETSLTLDGVSVVVDAGLSRRPEFDKAAGVTRLITTRASQASAAQRAGRAARQGPGVAYRLWEEAAHAGRAAYDPPEMLTSDLAPLTLALAQWGAGDMADMAWIDPPPAAALAAARAKLASLGALDGDGRITAHGRAMASLPMGPEQAHMLLYGAARGAGEAAAELAFLLQERGLGGRGDDLLARLERWRRDRSPKAEAARQMARGWARRAKGMVERVAGEPPPEGVLLAEGFPDNLAKRRDASGEEWLAAGGRGLALDPLSPLTRADYLAVGEAQGAAKGARITGAIALSEAEVLTHLAHRIERRSTLRWVGDEARVEALLERRLGAFVFARGSDPSPDPKAIAAFLCEKIRAEGLALLPLGRASLNLLKRARYAGVAALDEQALLDELEEWAAPHLKRRLDQVQAGALHQALLDRLGWDGKQAIDRLAPPEFHSPAGSSHAIDYEDAGGPSIEIRVQALFGLERHPTFGSPPQPLLLKLTSPGGKPIQTTRDLPGFWRGSWRDVVKDMKGRYPKHRWPDEPWAEDPSLKTKNAFNAGKKQGEGKGRS
ncbi:ATP-dependent helicase HrpB [Novosphingobium umbonatum]|uniref:ATP-dependent helicase HrpB n=1 Tax=Novosphingobium umbonatum TaxID=1908524 RepID=A0A437MXE5_9SPHN|nr:ATP-dependent helicase HrpB [Novosphingobium umbonatum]RVU02341.1 ATP-dependent helicase HrpB [Novosphingobium umbonatum]